MRAGAGRAAPRPRGRFSRMSLVTRAAGPELVGAGDLAHGKHRGTVARSKHGESASQNRGRTETEALGLSAGVFSAAIAGAALRGPCIDACSADWDLGTDILVLT